MMFSKTAYDERAARAKAITASLAAEGVRFIEMQFPDMNGMMRGKYAPLRRASRPAAPACRACCTRRAAATT